MRLFNFLLSIGVSLMLFGSCQKTVVNTTPLASLNLVNAVVNSGSVEVNFTNSTGKIPGEPYANISTTVGFGSGNAYSILASTTVPINVVLSTDTLSLLYSGEVNAKNGGTYSLYLAGQVGQVDSVFMQDTGIPYYTDSSCGVRFINLSQGSLPVNVTLAPTPGVNEFSSLGYKQITGFKQYAANSQNSAYTFNVIDVASDSLLASYTLTTPVFRNVTLALTGTNSSGLSISEVGIY
jgi:hypothetical protein